MRGPVKNKIQNFYSERIEYIESFHEALLDILFNVRMIGTSEIMNSANGEKEIYLNKTIGYNSQIILSEIFDDLTCSLELIKSAYFKQSNQILRNTLELTTQLIYTEYLIKSDKSNTPWINGERGVEDIYKMTKEIRRVCTNDFRCKLKEIEKFYNLLNMSTHSHKNQLNSKGIVTFDRFGVFGFESFYFHNAFNIHLCCLDIVLEAIKYFYSRSSNSYFKTELLERLDSICKKLIPFRDEIENYKKGEYEKGGGYLIFRKFMIIKEESLLYSYTANNTIIWPSKRKGKISDFKLIGKAIDNELIRKKIL